MSIFGGPKKVAEVAATPTPVNAEPISPTVEQLRRSGRASLLISTSSQGILGAGPKTGRGSLLSAT